MCKYCECGKNIITSKNEGIEVYINTLNKELYVNNRFCYLDRACINFCPMCGRDLRKLNGK